MSRFPTDRYDEQRLIQEVLYLHSLWHQGPPRPHPHPYPPIPTPTPTPTPTPVSLQPSSSIQFKKQKKKSKKLKETITDSGIEWPCPKTPTETPVVTDSGWPTFTTQLNAQPHLPTSQELSHFASNQAHQHALKAVSEYLRCSTNDEDDDNDSENDDEVDEGDKDYNFFAKLFREDGVLREYYEKNKENGGEFSCLVCCGVGKKGWMKRFKDCVALVQHSITIANTNTRRAHRAYGQVICQVLGWDINRLPSIVLTAGDNKSSESSDKLAEAQGNENDGGKNGLSGQSNTTDTVNVGSNELSQRKESLSTENQQENGDGSTALEGNENDGGINDLSGQSKTIDAVNVGSNELSQQKESFSTENQQEIGGRSTALGHNPPIEASANRSLEDVSIGIPETAKKNAEGASNCLEPLQEDRIVADGQSI
ncbi:PREDICTED: uncharacterized protein LOC109228732 isoform X2 [Nicotiana attenuata]|uniref:uncharacterized protein LOC109228732 isoform X2 n=1 Tax=Nicotiana attenuata TaxID=49451 RepID=UPI0009054A82|nr:PREDICTED: uncharacterized protein LOC109228732 isoform X2 [Nicotiana attenuata]